MPATPHCPCTRSRRRWLPDGTCATCRLTVHENSIMDAVKAILIADPKCLLWRNNVGVAQVEYGRRGRRPLVYGLCPGSADLIGCYGPRFLAIETKTVRGRLEPEQREFGTWIAERNAIYAVVRSESDARELLAWLRGDGPRPEFVFPSPPEAT